MGLEPVEMNESLRLGLYAFRTVRKVTQQELADALHISVSTLRKYENGRLGIPNSIIVNILLYLKIPRILIPRIPWLILGPDLYTYEAGSWPGELTEADLVLLEIQAQPSLYNTFPGLDILAASSRMLEYAEFLRPAPPGADRPVNLLEEVVTNPAAKEVFGDSWAVVAGGLALTFRTMGAGLLPPARMTEVLTNCSANPEFERLLAIEELTDDSFTASSVTLRVPESGEYKLHEIIGSGQDFPAQGWKMTSFVRVEP